MTFTELKAALLARGFSRLTDTQRGEYINAAITELDGMYPWPYRENSGQGTSPVTVSDLGEIEAVTDEDRNIPLEVVPYRNLLDWFGDLSTSGSPRYAYVAWPSGDPVVATYPTDGTLIGVQYWRVSPTLSGGSDEPLSPARFHYVIVALAARMAASDSGEDPTRFQAEADRGVQAMMLAILPDQLSGMVQRVGYGSVDW